MVLETRRGFTVLVMVLLAAGVAIIHLTPRRPADPCEAKPETYACAVFAAPDWLTRRVHAGRVGVPSRPPVSGSQLAASVDAPPLLDVVAETTAQSDVRDDPSGGV